MDDSATRREGGGWTTAAAGNRRSTSRETFEAPGHPFDGAPVVHRYTRAQAIADGSLVDVSDTAREAGLRLPTALTRAVWND